MVGTGRGSPHRRIVVRNRLHELFGNRIVALHEDIEWPPRSPDLTPCDFFLWGYLNDRVFKTPPTDIADLRRRIEMETDELRQNQQMIRRAVSNMLIRAQTCIDRDGGHVEGVGA